MKAGEYGESMAQIVLFRDNKPGNANARSIHENR